MIGGIIGHNFEATDTLSPTLVYTSPVISEKIFEKNYDDGRHVIAKTYPAFG